MEHLKALAQHALDALQQRGAERASCYIKRNNTTEANYENCEYTLMRTFSADKCILKASSGQKVGSATVYLLSAEEIDAAADQCIERMKDAPDDEYAAIWESNAVRSFVKGELEPDADGILKSIEGCIAYQSEHTPDDPLKEIIIEHHRLQEIFFSTYGARLDSDLGYYQMKRFFKPDLKDGFAGFDEMNEPYDLALKKAEKKPLEAPFVGTAVYCPKSLYRDWLLLHVTFLSEDSTLGENGVKHKWADKFGEQVTSPLFSISCMPMDPRICNASPFTPDGVVLQNTPLIEKGVLRDLWYSLKTARKLGRTPDMQTVDFFDDTTWSSTSYIIEPGSTPLSEIIAGIEKGIIIYAMPGSTPNDNDGNITGLIREGMLIENGKVVRPISEVSVRANFFDMYNNIRAVSVETTHMGGDILPWIAFDGIRFQ